MDFFHGVDACGGIAADPGSARIVYLLVLNRNREFLRSQQSPRKSARKNMDTSIATATITPKRKYCRLLEQVRDHEGRIRFAESVELLKEIDNLGRHMYLVRFNDGGTTFVFPNEVEMLTEAAPNTGVQN
jgi:hypothetical protein